MKQQLQQNNKQGVLKLKIKKGNQAGKIASQAEGWQEDAEPRGAASKSPARAIKAIQKIKLPTKIKVAKQEKAEDSKQYFNSQQTSFNTEQNLTGQEAPVLGVES